MGRKRNVYTDNFKIDAVKEALHNGADRAEAAIKYNIAQSTLSEWIAMFPDGKILTDGQKALEEKIAALEKQQETMLMELGRKQPEIDLLKKTGFYRLTLEVSNSKVSRQKRSKAYD
ncbi:transposase [Treponema sp.]|uniref:transposase n=1 Tax=Treponema sp. TaxID=166 RepID=UPI003F0017D4